MHKPKLDESITFIWRDLMDERSRSLATQALLRVLLGAALMVTIPYAIGFYIDGLTNQALDVLMVGGVLFFGLEIGRTALSWWQQQVREHFFQQAFWRIPQSITKLYLDRPLSWLSGESSEIDGGGVESLKDKVWNVANSYIFQIIPGFSVIVFGLIACAYANLYLGLIALVYIVLEIYLSNRVNRGMQTKMKPVIDQYKRWERRMQEWWRSVDHVKNQGVETKILRQIEREVKPALRTDDSIWRVYFAREIVKHRLRSLLFAVSLYALVGYLVFNESISLAVAVLVFFSFQRIRITLNELNDQQREVQFNLASIAKYRRVLTRETPFTYNSGVDFADEKISIKLKNVSHYVNDGGGRKLILNDVNLSIEAGEKVGIVGPSGAGKSQLVSLLVRAADPVSGQVMINNTNIRDLKLESFLRFCGVIMQQSEPFEDTILGNLLFGISHLDLEKPYDELTEAERTDIRDMADLALYKAGLSADIFPDGIDTWIGYKGLKLSGGQQQRLQIAAAHMKLMVNNGGPSLIIADEPTASLDSLSELTVMEHLKDSLPEETTSITIAHRLSTVANSDRIIFVRPLSDCLGKTPQVTVHSCLGELHENMPLFQEMAKAQGYRP